MARKRLLSAQHGTKAAIIAVVMASLGLGACVASSPEVAIDDAELVEGREIYAKNCASCHGASGGGGTGQKLSGGDAAKKFPNIEDQLEIVRTGRKRMPSYGGRLSDEEIKAVVRYTREVL